MTLSLQKLQDELSQMRTLLDSGKFYSLTPAEQKGLREGTADLTHKLSLVESGFLTVGLLGGTGVGKSTLMNALAGEEIASASHRRPHTDRILIYRHIHAPSPSLDMEDLAWGEVVHESNAVRQILLCDLPDFDSVVYEHIKRVLEFLEHLDLLIWVTSPEKYGDGRFYEFLIATAKAPGNFIFVLNKMDLLFQGGGREDGYHQMELIIDNFRKHLAENGVTEPILYPLSAQEFFMEGISPWNQLPAFSQQLFQQRNMKQIKHIKSANLDVEIRQLWGTLEREALHLKTYQAVLEDYLEDMKGAYPQWLEAGKSSTASLVREEIRSDSMIHEAGPYPLIGPGSVIAYFMSTFQTRAADHGPLKMPPFSRAISDGVTYAFRKRLEGVEARLERTLLEKNLPIPFREQTKKILDITNRNERLRNALDQVVLTLATNPVLPSFRFFKIIQWLTYLVLFVLFLFAIGGDAWLKLLENPSAANATGLVVAAIRTLFSSHGLAALLSYALLNLFFAIRFFNRYRGLMRRSTERLRKSIQKVLLEFWEAEMKDLMEGVEGLLKETKERSSFLKSFHGESSVKK